MRIGRPVARVGGALILIGLIGATPALAQRRADVPAAFAAQALWFSPAPMEEPGPKSRTVAGLLSFTIPGAGSFYARNNRHALEHLAIGVVSYSVAAWGGSLVSDCTYDQATRTDNCGPGVGLMVLGLGSFGLNTMWGFQRARDDVAKYNARLAVPGERTGTEIRNKS